MSRLHVRPRAEPSGRIQHVNPQSAHWEYVGFEVFRLESGARLEQGSDHTEVCIVIVSGLAHIATERQQWRNLGARHSPFDAQAPFAVYVPPRDRFAIEALSELEIALCKAPAEGRFPARLITPDECAPEVRGQGTNRRQVCNILFGNMAAEKLLVVEVITPAGHWSSYPPHKHDSAVEGRETRLEETYYHRLNPPQGFAFQRVYTDDRSLDETITVEDRSVVMVPRGYHPVGAPHGYELYYLNVMAGPERNWIFQNDPSHEWMLK